MGVIVTMGDGSFDLKEPDEWYPAILDRIEEGEDYGFGPTIRWVFHIDGDTNREGDPRETWGICSKSLDPRSKLYGWIKGVDPQLLPAAGEKLDLDRLAGKQVDIMFEHVEKDGIVRERVTKIRATKKPSIRKAATRKPEQGNLTAASGAAEDLEAPF